MIIQFSKVARLYTVRDKSRDNFYHERSQWFALYRIQTKSAFEEYYTWGMRWRSWEKIAALVTSSRKKMNSHCDNTFIFECITCKNPTFNEYVEANLQMKKLIKWLQFHLTLMSEFNNSLTTSFTTRNHWTVTSV